MSGARHQGRPVVLTVAGSDSGGGAGIQADLRAIASLGGFGATAIASLTAQSPQGVFGIHDVPPDFVERQMEVVFRDIGAAAVKTGMLGNAAAIGAVARRLAEYRDSLGHAEPCADSPQTALDLPQEPGIAVTACRDDGTALDTLPPAPVLPPFKLVVDPVMIATSGARLLEASAVSVLVDKLLPLATVVTPNVPEAEVLAGMPIADEEDLRAAGRAILPLLRRDKTPREPAWVLLKGGHLPGPEATDWLYDGQAWIRFATPRIDAPPSATHGTGCTYASALATALATLPPYTATARAKAHITARLRNP